MFLGIVQWLVYSGIGGEGTIINALNCGDVKQAIYFHKLIYEAILRTKLRHFNYSDVILTDEAKKLLEEIQGDVNFENLQNLVQHLKPIELVSRDMSYCK